MPIGVSDPDAPNPALPSVQDVADVIPRRALEGSGLATGTFTDETSPSAAQVRRVADKFGADVLAVLGGTVPASLTVRARTVAAVGAAAQLELSFFPETADTVSRPLFDRYDKDLARLVLEMEQATGEDSPGDSGGSQSPSFAFPAVTDDLSRLLAGYGAGPGCLSERPTYT